MPMNLKFAERALCAEMAASSIDIQADANSFMLKLRSEADSAQAVLSSEQLKQLGLQCLALMPSLEPRLAVPSIEEACRIPAYALKLLDDHEIQRLIRECQCDTLEYFLWYMKDADLLRLIVRNMSLRAAEMLMEDMEHRWHGRNPDKATESKARLGREAVEEIMKVARRMRDEGLIAELAEFGPPPERASASVPDSLTPDEVDALLKGVIND